MKREMWTVQEERTLREIWSSGKLVKECLDMLPGRSYRAMTDRMHDLGLGRRSHVRSGPVRSLIWSVAEQMLKRGEQLTTHEFSERIQCTHRHIWELLKNNHKAKEIHIAHWKRARHNGVWTEVWGYGEGPDAVKPKPKTRPETSRSAYLRKRMRQGKIEANPFSVVMAQVMREAA
jgi:hypothetical protein